MHAEIMQGVLDYHQTTQPSALDYQLPLMKHVHPFGAEALFIYKRSARMLTKSPQTTSRILQ